MIAQRLGLMADAVVALQHRDVADRIRHMGKYVVVVALDGLLAFVGLAHDQPADDDIERAEHHQHHRHPDVERQRGRHEEHQRHEGGKMLAHEFEPQRKQRIDRAQQRVQRVGGAALMMPGQRHGDDALEGVAKHACPARMGYTVGAARHQHEGDDVEGAEAGPQRQRGNHFALFGDCVDDTPEQDRFGDGHHGEDDVGAADERDALPVGAKIPECSPVNFEQ